MLHCTRDFITLANVYLPRVSIYFEAIFMRVCLNFSVIGHTNFDLDSSTYTKGSGTSGSMSTVGGFTNRFTPDGYTVSLSDINRILVVRSTANPMQTSGLWRVTGVDTVNNQLVLGLRGEPPAVESGLTWRLYEAETSNLPLWPNGTNSNTNEYRGRTSGSSTVRIILQSPHSTAWQVRLTYETATDLSTSLIVRNKATIAPGFGGDSRGDFPVGGQHLHGALFFNTSASNFATSTVVGLNPTDASGLCRYYIWGEDSTGTVVVITRHVDTVHSANNMAAWGLPEDEEYPNDMVPVRRLFAYGCTNIFNGGSGDINFRSGAAQQYGHGVVAMGYSGQPTIGAVSTYGYLSGQQSLGNGPRYSSNASDNPFLAATELQTVDLNAGMWDYGDFNGQVQSMILEPRRIGRFPIARLGRSNFGFFITSTDGQRTWLHTSNGVYLPWYGSNLP